MVAASHSAILAFPEACKGRNGHEARGSPFARVLLVGFVTPVAPVEVGLLVPTGCIAAGLLNQQLLQEGHQVQRTTEGRGGSGRERSEIRPALPDGDHH